MLDCSLPGSSVHGILRARILEWVAIPFSKGSSWPRDWTQVSCIAGRFFTIQTTREALLLLLLLLSRFSRVQLCATPWTAAHQASPSLGFSRQKHWSGLPFPSPMHESEKWKWSHSVMSDSATPWTAAYQAPLPLGFSRQEYWSGVPLPSPWRYTSTYFIRLLGQFEGMKSPNLVKCQGQCLSQYKHSMNAR